MLPGIESWYSLGNKAKTGRKQGMEKVEQVSEVLAQPGGRDHLRHYCAADVVITAGVWMRLQLLMGTWSPEAFRSAAASLVTVARSSMPGLGPWLDRVDRRVWMLDAPAVAA